MYDLDAIINATIGTAEIISEQHDASAIDLRAGLADAAEMIKVARSRGMSEEEAGRAAALGRANLDTTGGRVRVMIAGQAPWHKLGVNVKNAVNSADAIRLAGLDWRVGKLPLAYTFAAEQRFSEDSAAIVRMDNGGHLGTVGNRYQPIQNEEGFAFLDSVIGEFGARYETAGSVRGGRAVWMEVHLPRQAFTVGGERERVEPYAIFVNPHDGTGAASCYPTSERVVCANTLRVANSKDSKKGIRIRHTGNVRDKIRDAQHALGMAVKGFDRFKDAAQAMSAKPMDIAPYAHAVLDAICEVTQADMAKGFTLDAMLQKTQANLDLDRARKSWEKKADKRRTMYAGIMTAYESERSPQRGTAWAALNAVTEYADHGMHRVGRQVGTTAERQDRRFESVLAGDADEMKQVAYNLALTAR